jgi:hypothetical protein
MKFALYALLGAAAASNFLQDTIMELDATKPVDVWTLPAWKDYAITNKVGEGQC